MADDRGLELVPPDDEITVDVEPADGRRRTGDDDERRACLVFLAGPLMGHSVLLTETPQEVGRAEDADIVITDSGVSRRHARFYLRDDGAFVEDLDSSNGVYVNGRRVERFQHLEAGDKITLGTVTILKFTYHDQIDEDFQQRLLESAIRDPLTGLYNRAYFDRQLQTEFIYAQRHAGRLALIIFDLDHFKQLNDNHGHLAGDAVLDQIGDLLGEAVRQEDFMARYGGEELAMICRGLSGEHAFYAAERLRRLVEAERFVYEDETFEVTLSAGYAVYPETEVDAPDELIDAADEALYAAQEAGRNQTAPPLSD